MRRAKRDAFFFSMATWQTTFFRAVSARIPNAPFRSQQENPTTRPREKRRMFATDCETRETGAGKLLTTRSQVHLMVMTRSRTQRVLRFNAQQERLRKPTAVSTGKRQDQRAKLSRQVHWPHHAFILLIRFYLISWTNAIGRFCLTEVFITATPATRSIYVR